MRLSRLAAIVALSLGLVLLAFLSVSGQVTAQTPTAATPRPATPGTPAATPRPATPTAAATAAATATATRAPSPTAAATPGAAPRTGAGGLDGQYVTALWVVGWGLVTLGSLYLVLRRRRA